MYLSQTYTFPLVAILRALCSILSVRLCSDLDHIAAENVFSPKVRNQTPQLSHRNF